MENKSYAAFLSKKFGFTICSDFSWNTNFRISRDNPIRSPGLHLQVGVIRVLSFLKPYGNDLEHQKHNDGGTVLSHIR